MTQGYLIGEIVRRITGESIGAWFAREVAKPLDADFHIGLPASEDHRVSNVIPPPPLDPAAMEGQVSELMLKTFMNPPIDATNAHQEWWRRAEIPAANGQGNARSVAAIQSIIAGRGEARGVRLLSAEGTDPIFEVQAEGIDKVLGVQERMGMGYGLSNPPEMPLGPRACYWGGYGGSVIIIDQDAELAVCYVMNRMESGLVGDLRGHQHRGRHRRGARSALGQHRLGFDLHLPGGVQQCRHDDHGRGRPHVPEELAVHGTDGVSVLDGGDVHPRPHDVVERATRLGQRRRDDLEAPPRLVTRVVGTAAARHHRARARDHDPVAHPHGPAEADGRLEG